MRRQPGLQQLTDEKTARTAADDKASQLQQQLAEDSNSRAGLGDEVVQLK